MPLFGDQPGDLLHTILENVGVAIAVIDSNRNIVYLNHSAENMFGMSSLSKPVHISDWAGGLRFQDSLGREITLDGSVAIRTLAGEIVEQKEFQATFPNGETKWLRASAHQFSVLGLAGVLLIITDETKEAELQRASEQVRRMDDIGSIAAALAHNFNNVLSTISMNVALAQQENGVPETTLTRLDHITNAIEKAAGMVRRLMQFGRARQMQMRPAQANFLVDEALKLARPILGDTMLVRTYLRPDLPEIEVDPSEIEQVLVNLFVNAKDAMPNGGVLTIATELDRSESRDGKGFQHFVAITVADTGIGIKEDIQDRIFNPFFTTKAEKGTGLGLSSAYAVLRQHNGNISVQSAPGKGAKFTIHLPARQSARSDQGGVPPAA